MNDTLNKITVFVISTENNPNYNACIDALKKQTIKFKLDIIKNYCPLSKAFQEMINRCTTEYYIEVDEDMILAPNGIEKMYNSINHTEDKISMAVHKLHDVHLNFNIYGIKIYKHRIFKNYPYNQQHPSCEVEQLDRMKKDGYSYLTISEIIGTHSPYWNNELIFERYYNLMEKFKLYHYDWLEKVPVNLWNILKQNPTKQNLFALTGALSSILSDKTMECEKNMQTKQKDYFKMKTFFENPIQATIYMTDKCNFKCDFCYRQHGLIEPSVDADVHLVNTLIQKFPSIMGVCVCGFGEPLLSPNLKWVLQALKNTGRVIGLITNGSLLKEKISELSIPSISPNYISISLNAHNEAEHQKITKTNTWKVVIEGIEASLKSPIPTYITYVVTTENMIFIPEFLKLAKLLGIKTVYLHNVLPHFDKKENKFFWDLALVKEHQPIIDGWKELPEASIVKKFPVLIEKNNNPARCVFPYKMIGVNGSGNISICNSVFPCSSKFGNLYNNVVWCSSGNQEYRQNFMDKQIRACDMCFRNWEK